LVGLDPMNLSRPGDFSRAAAMNVRLNSAKQRFTTRGKGLKRRKGKWRDIDGNLLVAPPKNVGGDKVL
jgi:hypothetical protein